MVLNFLLIIGILLNLLTGVDFLLRPHQRKQIQEFFEDLTLQVDDIQAADLISKVHTSGIQALFVMMTYFEFAIVAIAALIFQAPEWQSGGSLEEAFGQQGRIVQLIAVTLSVMTLLFAWHWPLPNIMRWLIRDGRQKGMRLRSAGITVFGILFFGLYQLALSWAVGGLDDSIFQKGSSQQAIYMWGLLPIWPVFTIFWVVYQSTGLLLNPKSSITRSFLSFFKSTLWRIVEYNKGAVAAMTFLLTFVLTIVKLVIG